MEPRLVSRGNGDSAYLADLYVTASMEPRLVSRGNCPSRSISRASPGRFNGAAARKPRKHPREGESWADLLASMEPRLVSRGNLPRDVRDRRALPASMEPRLVSRGNWMTVNQSNVLNVLQWSRGS